MGTELGAPRPQRVDEAFVVDAERVGAAVVVPDPGLAERVRVRLDRPDHVVALEVGGAVEGAGRRFAAVEPERGRVAAGRAEATGVLQRQVVGAEAAHRDAADRHPLGVDPEAAHDPRNRFLHHVGRPAPAAAVVPVAVVAAVGEGDDHAAPLPQLWQASEDGVVEGLLRAAAAVQEDEQRALPPRPGPRRHDHVDPELLSDRLAAQVQVDEPGPVPVGGREDGRGQGQVGEGGQRGGEDRDGRAPAPPDLPLRRPFRSAHARHRSARVAR
ncbi:MAG TPA: hypothetical protein VFY48_08910 [Solirubrobacterales bacterium]|nr:hypothetical protein [Solirubrobacterales bacterium]